MSDRLEADAGEWPPFTAEERTAILAAYEALTRVGNATALLGARGDRTPDGWDGIIDRAHHDLGLLMVRFHLDGITGLPITSNPTMPEEAT